MAKFEILFFMSNRGEKPIERYLNQCPNHQRSKILRQIMYLEEFGLTRANSSLKRFTDSPLWEVRILGKDNIRLFCGQVGKIIVVLHIFIKKKQATPATEIKIALGRLKLMLDR